MNTILEYLRTNQDKALNKWRARISSKGLVEEIEMQKLLNEKLHKIYAALLFLAKNGNPEKINYRDEPLFHHNSKGAHFSLSQFLEAFFVLEEIFSEDLLNGKRWTQSSFDKFEGGLLFDQLNQFIHTLIRYHAKAFCGGCIQPLETLNQNIISILRKKENRKGSLCLA